MHVEERGGRRGGKGGGAEAPADELQAHGHRVMNPMLCAGLFQRACQRLSDMRAQHDLAEELGGLKSALMERLEGIAGGLTDERRIVDGNLWLGQDEAEAVASQLAPKLEKSRGDIEAMLFEVVTLEVCALNFSSQSPSASA